MDPNKDDNLVSYSAVLAKRQRLMAEPKGVPPPQGVSAPEPIRQGIKNNHSDRTVCHSRTLSFASVSFPSDVYVAKFDLQFTFLQRVLI